MVVHSMDRLARNLDDLRRLVQQLTKRGVRIEFVKESLTFTGEGSPMANLLLSVMGAFAKFERALIRERQREGIALAKQRGAYRGRKRAVFFNRLGEIRDRSFEQQRYRASGLNLVTAAIILWNTVYLERATQRLRESDKPIDDALLQYLSPLGWEHIMLTGDYVWRQSRKIEDGQFRPLRIIGKLLFPNSAFAPN